MRKVFGGNLQFAKLVAAALVGHQLYCEQLPLELAPLCLVHPSGFLVIVKKPPLVLLRRLWELVLHTRSTLLTLSGSEKFFRTIGLRQDST